MRPILAIALLLVALSGNTPKPNHPSWVSDYLGIADNAARPLMEIESSIKKADRLAVASLLPRSLPVETIKPEPVSANPQTASADADMASDAAMSAALDSSIFTGTSGMDGGPAGLSLDDLCNTVLAAAQDNDLPIPFFANLLWQESGLRNDIVSSKGAQGIAQFMPDTAAEKGLANPFDPMQAIPASARFLHELRMEFGNLGFVAAAYNAGPNRVIDWLERRASLPQETRDYVLNITGLSIDAWRRIAVNDDALTFVRALSCRSMPAFASMEESQSPQALFDQAMLQQAEHDETAPKPHSDQHQAAVAAHPRARREARIASPERRSAKREVTPRQQVVRDKRQSV